MTKFLFVCSANKQRSRTAEELFLILFPNLEFDSGGTNHKMCFKEGTTPLTEDQVNWADRVYVMEEKHRQIINKNTSGKYGNKIILLNIPDRYQYNQKELIEILEAKVKQDIVKNSC
jgi:predicted protein tyrosine phosphatase